MLSLNVLRTPKYVQREGAEQRAVAVSHALSFKGVHESSRTFHLPPQLLPFGLCGGAKVVCAEGTAAVRYKLVLRKSNGMRTSDWHAVNSTVDFFAGEMENSDDSHHEHIKSLFSKTGHDFRFRYFAALTLISATLEFDAPPPDAFSLVFFTVNAVDKELSLGAIGRALEKRERIDFTFTPVLPKDRLLAAAGTSLSEPPSKTPDELKK
jgi:hypothetical protein